MTLSESAIVAAFTVVALAVTVGAVALIVRYWRETVDHD